MQHLALVAIIGTITASNVPALKGHEIKPKEVITLRQDEWVRIRHIDGTDDVQINSRDEDVEIVCSSSSCTELLNTESAPVK